MAAQLSELVIYGLNESLFTEYVGKVKAVTAAEVQRAANQHPAGQIAVIVVGDLSKIGANPRPTSVRARGAGR